MPRVKKATNAMKRRRNVLKEAKGYRFGRKKKEKMAKEALRHAGSYAFRDRKNKKRTFRQKWSLKINAAVRKHGLTYSTFIDALKKKNIEVDRKILADLAENHPKVFEKITEEVK
jgi:large subunit ribosomal protein L20